MSNESNGLWNRAPIEGAAIHGRDALSEVLLLLGAHQCAWDEAD